MDFELGIKRRKVEEAEIQFEKMKARYVGPDKDIVSVDYENGLLTLQDGTSNNNIITIEQYGSEEFKHFTYVATRGQTTFSGSDALGQTLAYTANNPLGGGVKVYLNGVRLRANTDVVATNGTEVVLQDGAGNNDVVMIESLGPYPYKSFEYVASKGATVFSGQDRFGKRLDYEVNKTTVYLNGIKLKESTDWTAVSGSTVVLQEPLANNDVITNLTSEREFLGCLRRDEHVTVLYKQKSKVSEGDYLGRLVLGIEDGEIKIFGATEL